MIKQFIETQIAFSRKTFGPGMRTEGVCKHIEKELAEIRANPTDVTEWVDVILLALDGAWRCALYSTVTSDFIVNAYTRNSIAALVYRKLISKAHENYFEREWPEPTDSDSPVEHVRKEDVDQ